MVTDIEKIKVNKEFLKKIESACSAALSYEKATNYKRKLGITGEVGEVRACKQLGLDLVIDSRSQGFDAIDKKGLHVQIKARRSESEEKPRDIGRMSRFSKHKFDYALLVLLDPKYKLCEIWRANYDKLKPVIEKQKRRNPSLSAFKKAGKKYLMLKSNRSDNTKRSVNL